MYRIIYNKRYNKQKQQTITSIEKKDNGYRYNSKRSTPHVLEVYK